MAGEAVNRLLLACTLRERDDLRYTPAGIAVLQMTLEHASSQREAGGERKVACEIAAIAFDDVALGLAALAPGSAIRCEGFLARRYRTGTTLALHVERFEAIDARDTEPNLKHTNSTHTNER